MKGWEKGGERKEGKLIGGGMINNVNLALNIPTIWGGNQFKLPFNFIYNHGILELEELFEII